jgi:hypothetical protein
VYDVHVRRGVSDRLAARVEVLDLGKDRRAVRVVTTRSECSASADRLGGTTQEGLIGFDLGR